MRWLSLTILFVAVTVGAQPLPPATTPWSRALLKQTNGVPISPYQYGATFSSDPWNGGGTDDSSAIQAALDQATNGPIEVVIPKGALISTNLVLRSNTKLRFLPGAGLFMAPHKDCWVIGNQQNTNYSTTNVVIEGGILNANGNSQSEYVTNGYRLSGAPGVWGVWFAGVDGLTLRDVKLMNSKTYQFLFNDSRNILMENCWVYCTNNPVLTNTFYGNDGVHLMCNLQNFICRNFRYTAGSDDAFAIMTDETDSTLQVRDSRWTTNSGSISNVVFDGVWIESGKNIGKMQTYGSTNAYAHNVTLRNIHGDATSQGFVELDIGNGFKANNFVIDGMDIIIGGSADSFALPMIKLDGIITDTIRVSNVRLLDRGGGGIGTSGLMTFGPLSTNRILNNIYIEGSANSIGAGDAAISFLGAGTTNQPNTSIMNLTALKMNAVLDAVDGTQETTPIGVFKLSNIHYTPTSVLNGGGFTNFMSDLIGNGSGLTNLIAPLTIQSNFLSGVWYTNLTGRPQSVQQTYAWTDAGVNGTVKTHFITGQQGAALGTWVTNDTLGQQTITTTLVVTNCGHLGGFVSNSIVWCFTNQVVGAGNSTVPISGTGQLITY